MAAPEVVLGPVPAWVKPLAELKAVPPPTGAPVRQLRIDQQLHFGAEGDSVYYESVVRIQTSQGLAAMGTIALPWNPDSTTLTVHRLEIRRGAETIDVLADQTFTVLRRENRLEYAMLDGVLTATLQPEGLEVGDTVVLAFTLTRKDSVTGDWSENYITGLPDSPAEQYQLRALWDSSRPIRWRLDQGLEPPKVTRKGGETELVFDLKGLKPPKPPAGAPARYLRGRGVEFTQFQTWGQVSALMAPLYDKASTLSSTGRLRGEIDKIRAASNDPKVQAGLALTLVQERVRYVFLGMNAGNLTPADADATWSRRYGDCKGKTALLLAILRELGINAEAATVSIDGGDGMNDRLPMISLFDHVIVRASIGGKTYWLDGTRTGDRRLDDVVVPPFHWALPLRATGGELEALKVEPPPQPLMALDVDIDASKGLYASAPFKVVQTFRGDLAITTRMGADAAKPEELDGLYRKYWSAMYGFVDIDKTSSQYDEATGEMRLIMEGKANLDWSSSQDSAALRYLADSYLLGGAIDYKREEGQDAKAPYAVSYPFHVYYRETIKLPDGGKGFTTAGEDVDKVVGGVSYYRRTAIKDGAFFMETRGRSLVAEFPAAEAEANQKALADMAKVEVYAVAPTGYKWNADDRAGRIALMDRAIKKDPKSAGAWAGRGWLYRESKDYARAEADYSQAIALKDEESDYYALRAITLIKQGKTAAGMADFATARAKAGKDPSKLNTVCWELATNNLNLDQALADCDAALQVEPRNAAILDSRGFVQMRMGRFKDSVADYDKALGIRPDESASLFGRGLAKRGAGDAAGGDADLSAARKLDAGVDEEFAGYGVTVPAK